MGCTTALAGTACVSHGRSTPPGSCTPSPAPAPAPSLSLVLSTNCHVFTVIRIHCHQPPPPQVDSLDDLGMHVPGARPPATAATAAATRAAGAKVREQGSGIKGWRGVEVGLIHGRAVWG